MRFQRRPTVIEATQWHLGDQLPGVTLAKTGDGFVRTINGSVVLLHDGDWVVQEPDGIHYYPIAEQVFKELYSPTQDPNEPATQLQLAGSEAVLSPVPATVKTPQDGDAPVELPKPDPVPVPVSLPPVDPVPTPPVDPTPVPVDPSPTPSPTPAPAIPGETL